MQGNFPGSRKNRMIMSDLIRKYFYFWPRRGGAGRAGEKIESKLPAAPCSFNFFNLEPAVQLFNVRVTLNEIFSPTCAANYCDSEKKTTITVRVDLCELAVRKEACFDQKIWYRTRAVGDECALSHHRTTQRT